jgi:phage terminase large subunit GpA-like protein
MPESHNPVERAASAAWKPQDLRTPWEWCEEYVVVDSTSPLPGKWRSANSPWVKEVMEVAADKRVTVIAVKCSAQSSKTQTFMGLLCYDISEDPGPTMYVLANKEDAEDFVRDRVSPTFDNCKPVKELMLREAKLGYTFSTMPLYFVGAGSMAKLQGKPIKRLYLDEVRNYPSGALQTVRKRVRAFGSLAQEFMVSTPDAENDDVDMAFRQGDQRTPHFPCPACGCIQQLRFEQLKWDRNEETKPGGQWNFDILASTIRYECENNQCGHRIQDTPLERKNLCRSSRFVRMNPNAPRHHVSFTWNALLPWWVSWRGIVEEFLNARISARAGNLEPLKTFINETLGESWKDELGVIEDFGFLEARKGDYDFGDKWPESKRRFIAADKQEKGGEHYWYVVREFGDFGKSRLVSYGMCRTKQELEILRKENGVPILNAMIDSGYEAQDVYRFCASTGWKAFKGDQCDFYVVTKPDPKHRGQFINVRQMWRLTKAAVYNAQTKRRIGFVPLYTFASDPTSDMLMEYMTGLVGEWTIPKTTARDYFKQITAEHRVEKVDGRGRVHYVWEQKLKDNHLRDCEKMIQIGAIISKTIAASAPVQEAKAVHRSVPAR